MWASAPTTDLAKRRILRADRVVRPYKWYEKTRGSCKNCRISRFVPGQADVGIGPYNRPRKRNIFPFYAVGVDAYIDPQETPVLWRFSGETVLIFHFTS